MPEKVRQRHYRLFFAEGTPLLCREPGGMEFPGPGQQAQIPMRLRVGGPDRNSGKVWEKISQERKNPAVSGS
jgi:hypothetical protein